MVKYGEKTRNGRGYIRQEKLGFPYGPNSPIMNGEELLRLCGQRDSSLKSIRGYLSDRFYVAEILASKPLNLFGSCLEEEEYQHAVSLKRLIESGLRSKRKIAEIKKTLRDMVIPVYFIHELIKEVKKRENESETKDVEKEYASFIEARNKIIEGNLSLVFFKLEQSMRFIYRNFSGLDDFLQIGARGLILAAERYDPSNSEFSTYVVRSVKQQILRSVSQSREGFGIPPIVVTRARQIEEAEDSKLKSGVWVKEGDLFPQLDELCKLTGFNKSVIEEARNAWDSKFYSVVGKSPDGEQDNLESRIVGKNLQPVDDVAVYERRSETKGIIFQILKDDLNSDLNPARVLRILEMRFGLDGGESMTLEEVGKVVGLTRERIRQIQNIALEAIRGSDLLEKLIDISGVDFKM